MTDIIDNINGYIKEKEKARRLQGLINLLEDYKKEKLKKDEKIKKEKKDRIIYSLFVFVFALIFILGIEKDFSPIDYLVIIFASSFFISINLFSTDKRNLELLMIKSKLKDIYSFVINEDKDIKIHIQDTIKEQTKVKEKIKKIRKLVKKEDLNNLELLNRELTNKELAALTEIAVLNNIKLKENNYIKEKNKQENNKKELKSLINLMATDKELDTDGLKELKKLLIKHENKTLIINE